MEGYFLPKKQLSNIWLREEIEEKHD